MKQYHYSVEEIGCEMVFNAILDGKFAHVLHAEKDEEGFYYWGYFSNYCDEKTLNSKKAFRAFVLDNDTEGFSTGSFNSVKEINEDEEFQDFISEFGTFDDF